MDSSTSLTTHLVPGPTKHLRSKRRESIRSILITLAILVIAPLLAVMITSFVLQSYKVDGPSMETTLQDHDRLLVNKLGKTWSLLTGKQYIPHRGSIIVFKQKEGLKDGEHERQLVKRVIGLPGDRVVLQDGHITIYNSTHPEGFDPDKDVSWSSAIGETSGMNTDTIINSGEVFVCGDNRVNSVDSRTFGKVKSENIVGSLSFRVLPINTARHF